MEQNKTQGMLNAQVMFQDGADLEPTQNLRDFSRSEHAQASHEPTEHSKTQLGSVPFVDAMKLLFRAMTHR